MIIFEVVGGLGNQMFQYAAGRSLSLSRGEVLYLDVSGFDGYHLHNGFELDRIFKAQFQLATSIQVKKCLGWKSLFYSKRLTPKWLKRRWANSSIIPEPHFQYWEGIWNSPVNCWLRGYWQSEKYFKMDGDILRNDLSFKEPMNYYNSKIAEMIHRSNAISLHIRRGDYASNPKTTEVHGICSLDYYRMAIQYLVERVENPIFFIFSDDLKWVKDNFSIEFKCHFVDQNYGVESYNDMRLMSLCDHHIIANSSFSWWGAWLNPKKDKIVVAPAKWFSEKKMLTTNISDLFPDDWIVL